MMMMMMMMMMMISLSSLSCIIMTFLTMEFGDTEAILYSVFNYNREV